MQTESQWQKVLRLIIAFGIGLALAGYAYFWVTDPEPARQRALEERVVLEARATLVNYLSSQPELQIIDPLEPNRKVGKVYIYPASDGWEISGFYRRDEADVWHPWLMNLDAQLSLLSLAVRDSDQQLNKLAAGDKKFSVEP